MRYFLIVAVALSGMACTALPPTPQTANVGEFADEEGLVVCKKEKPTGSNRPVTVCRRAADEFEREQTERDVRVLQRQSEQIQNRL